MSVPTSRPTGAHRRETVKGTDRDPAGLAVITESWPARMGAAGLACDRRRYGLLVVRGVARGVLDPAGGVLDLALGLVRLALGLQLGVAGHLPGGFLDAALSLLGGARDAILVHGTSPVCDVRAEPS